MVYLMGVFRVRRGLVKKTPNKDLTYLIMGKQKVALRTIRTLILGLTLVLLGAGVGYEFRGRGGVSGLSQAIGTRSIMPLSRDQLDFGLFWQVWDKLEQSYVDPDKIDPERMVYGAIEGMTASLGDPYTVFLPPQENQAAKEDLNGEFDGVGIQLGYKNDTLAVQTPLDGHPAIKKGVRAGDLILNIKDELEGVDTDTVDMTLPEAVKLIRGKKGTDVTLTLYREEKGRFDVTITRDTIVIPSVEMEIGDFGGGKFTKADDGKIAWIKLRRFGDNTQSDWDQAIAQIIAKREQLDGIVLDVRNNPGGYLNTAINLASDFVTEGVIVQQKGRFDTKKYTVTRRSRLLGIPVVVLINEGSASASEILAGALRDRLQTKLIGEKSFGKGTVQEALDLADNAGLHVTTARWLLPSGDWIHEDGLKPDVQVSLPEVDSASDSAEIIDTQLQKAIETLRSL